METDRTGSDDSGGSPWEIPEDFVFDEEFIKGGVHEPPASARIAAAARNRVPPTPHPVSEPDPPVRPRGRPWFSFLAVLMVFVVVGASVFTVSRAPQAGFGDYDPATAVPGLPVIDVRQVSGIRIVDTTGTCYQSEAPSQSSLPQTLKTVDCSAVHDLELVGTMTVERVSATTTSAAAGTTSGNGSEIDRSTAYPCVDAVTRYIGRASTGLADTELPYVLVPTNSQATGFDMRAFCLLALEPGATGLHATQ